MLLEVVAVDWAASIASGEGGLSFSSSGFAMRKPPSAWDRLMSPLMALPAGSSQRSIIEGIAWAGTRELHSSYRPATSGTEECQTSQREADGRRTADSQCGWCSMPVQTKRRRTSRSREGVRQTKLEHGRSSQSVVVYGVRAAARIKLRGIRVAQGLRKTWTG